jgi:lysophospholipase L1-like esterase
MKHPFLYIAAAAMVAVPTAVADELDDLKAAADAVYKDLKSHSFVPYKKPTQRVSEWIALGDSYTAGTGANGKSDGFAGDAFRGKKSYPMQMSMDHDNWGFINGDTHLPQFSFHAYTGDTTKELVKEQLKQGDFRDEIDKGRGQQFGKPQLATLTIGGNDALLAK